MLELVSWFTILACFCGAIVHYRCSRCFHFFGSIPAARFINSYGFYMDFALARESRKPWPLVLFEVAFDFCSGTNQSRDPRLWISRAIVGGRENCDLRGFNQFSVRLVHTAIGRHQKPTLLVAEFDDFWIFHSLCYMLRFVITEMICETLHARITSIPETFTIRLTEGIFKK